MSDMTMTHSDGLGRIVSTRIVRPGAAARIAANGWTCQHGGCKETPTVEVAFVRQVRGGCAHGSHGTCEAHAKAHAKALKADADRRAAK